MDTVVVTGAGAHASQVPGLPREVVSEAWRFLARLVGWYTTLLLMWLVLGGAFRHAVIALGNAASALARPITTISFQPLTRAKDLGLSDAVDVVVLVQHRDWRDEHGRQQQILAKGIVTFSQPYAATALLVALFGATRLPWRVRFRRAALALAVLSGLMLACVAVDAAHTLATHGALLHCSRWFTELVAILYATVSDWPAGVTIVPLLLWLLFAWPRRGRLQTS